MTKIESISTEAINSFNNYSSAFTAPELLLPAGNLEKLKVACLYGAHAVYVGGQKFGLRSRADNFTEEELQEGIDYAHARQVKMYVVLNAFLHDKELMELPSFLSYLEKIGVDAVIVSDLGVVKVVRDHCNIPIHLSTQASCLNIEAARFYKKLGVKRIILGREATISEAGRIKREVGLEIELFIHGSMCMAYSGHCTISNYTSGRDSNRGGCAHSCRFEYTLEFGQGMREEEKREEEKVKAYFMNSKDLQGISLLPEFFQQEIDSVKIEGRMKSPLYVGTLAKIYRQAIEVYQAKKSWTLDEVKKWEEELEKLVDRGVTSGNLAHKAEHSSVNWSKEKEEKEHDYVIVGQVLENHDDEFMLIEVRNAFHVDDPLEVLPFEGDFISFRPQFITNFKNKVIEKTSPNTLVKVPFVKGALPMNLIRLKKEKH